MIQSAMQKYTHKITKKLKKRQRRARESRAFKKTRDRDLNGAVGWNSLESAATNEVKIKIYVLL